MTSLLLLLEGKTFQITICAFTDVHATSSSPQAVPHILLLCFYDHMHCNKRFQTVYLCTPKQSLLKNISAI